RDGRSLERKGHTQADVAQCLVLHRQAVPRTLDNGRRRSNRTVAPANPSLWVVALFKCLVGSSAGIERYALRIQRRIEVERIEASVVLNDCVLVKQVCNVRIELERFALGDPELVRNVEIRLSEPRCTTRVRSAKGHVPELIGVDVRPLA